MAAGTQPTTTTKQQSAQDIRRIAEDDPDFTRLHASTRRKLRASAQQLVRELKASPATEHAAVQSRFIARHVGILKDAYARAHQEGQRDYWQQVSKKPGKHLGAPNEQRQRKVLGFYAPSVAKMAHQAEQAWQQSQAKTHPSSVKMAEQPQSHTGVMVAFMLAPDAAKQLVLPGGEPAEDMHITLAYLGDMSDLSAAQLAAVRHEVASFASEVPPLKGQVSGIARFTPSASSDGKAPVVALVNVPGIQAWRGALVKRLEAVGLVVAKDFEYTPHITLAYNAEGAALPVKALPSVNLRLDRVTLAIGEQQQTWVVGDEQYPVRQFSNPFYTRDMQLAEHRYHYHLADPEDLLDVWLEDAYPRINLQADLTWAGLQDGYFDGPLTDPANPYYYLYWDLDDGVHQHCGDCPDYAAGSPYTPPGSGVNELDATPGDGTTACGAACKCSLRYGSGGFGDQMELQWNQAWKYYQDHPDEFMQTPAWQAAIKQGMPTPVVLPVPASASVDAQALPDSVPYSAFTDDQKGALDAYRDAAAQWDAVRGQLAPLPSLFSDAETANWTPPAWDSLTTAQQDALAEAMVAMVEWGIASDEAVDEAFASIGITLDNLGDLANGEIDWNDFGEFREDGSGQTFSNPYPRQAGGRWGFGNGPMHAAPGGSGGGGSGGSSAQAHHIAAAQQRLTQARQDRAQFAQEHQRASDATRQALAVHNKAQDDAQATEWRVRDAESERYIAAHAQQMHPSDVAEYRRTQGELAVARQRLQDARAAYNNGTGSLADLRQAQDDAQIAGAAHGNARMRLFHAQGEAAIDAAVGAHPDVVAARAHANQTRDDLNVHTSELRMAANRLTFADRRVDIAEGELHVAQGNTWARVEYKPDASGVGIGGKEAVHNVFGRDLSGQELSNLSGAHATDKITISRSRQYDGFDVEVRGPTIERSYSVETDPHTGEIILHDHLTRNLGDRNTESGQDIIHGMDAAHQLGVDRIRASAARGAHYNGYNTWPKLGFDGKIPSHVIGEAQHRFGPGVSRVSDILKLPGGRAWWKAHGDTFDAEFNFHDPAALASLKHWTDLMNRHQGGGSGGGPGGGQP